MVIPGKGTPMATRTPAWDAETPIAVSTATASIKNVFFITLFSVIRASLSFTDF